MAEFDAGRRRFMASVGAAAVAVPLAGLDSALFGASAASSTSRASSARSNVVYDADKVRDLVESIVKSKEDIYLGCSRLSNLQRTVFLQAISSQPFSDEMKYREYPPAIKYYKVFGTSDDLNLKHSDINYDLIHSLTPIRREFLGTIGRDLGMKDNYIIGGPTSEQITADLKIYQESSNDLLETLRGCGKVVDETLILEEVDKLIDSRTPANSTERQRDILRFNLSSLAAQEFGVQLDVFRPPFSTKGPLGAGDVLRMRLDVVGDKLAKASHVAGDLEFVGSVVFNSLDSLARSGEAGRNLVGHLPELLKSVCIMRYFTESYLFSYGANMALAESFDVIESSGDTYFSVFSSVVNLSEDPRIKPHLEYCSAEYLNQLRQLPDKSAYKQFERDFFSLTSGVEESDKQFAYRGLSILARTNPSLFAEDGMKLPTPTFQRLKRSQAGISQAFTIGDNSPDPFPYQRIANITSQNSLIAACIKPDLSGRLTQSD